MELRFMENDESIYSKEKSLFKEILSNLCEIYSVSFNLTTPEGIALCFMLDSALRYCESVSNQFNPLIAEESREQLGMYTKDYRDIFRPTVPNSMTNELHYPFHPEKLYTPLPDGGL
jgi:hypothetical protein